ncbi:MAG: hypothetical protein BWY79_01411 [Actinobacteria bacterium ADurb.Bin444]|nr:MAG: hypothetical protein BWY79_01411 [Actinobacteria bacterium ADurb.Bin444]
MGLPVPVHRHHGSTQVIGVNRLREVEAEDARLKPLRAESHPEPDRSGLVLWPSVDSWIDAESRSASRTSSLSFAELGRR